MVGTEDLHNLACKTIQSTHCADETKRELSICNCVFENYSAYMAVSASHFFLCIRINLIMKKPAILLHYRLQTLVLIVRRKITYIDISTRRKKKLYLRARKWNIELKMYMSYCLPASTHIQ